jgi:hypothetical protein
MSYEIGWEKFKFPDEEEDDEEVDEFEEDTEYDDEENDNGRLLSVIPQQINPFFQLKKYNLWTGHTNFKITEAIVLIIENELGVETLDIITPYRFHMSIGKRFNEKEVKLNVTNTVINFIKKYEKNK